MLLASLEDGWLVDLPRTTLRFIVSDIVDWIGDVSPPPQKKKKNKFRAIGNYIRRKLARDARIDYV